MPAAADDAVRRALYLEARHAVRRLALRNPLLDFDAVLFVKSAPGRFPHCRISFMAGGPGLAAGCSCWKDSRRAGRGCAPDGRHAGGQLPAARPVV
ncbi:MAG: hypothetical protein U0736_02595 [Gemmataceae bacterium]